MKKNKEALILDAGFAAVPLLRSVKAQGFAITVCSGKAQDPGHQFADSSVVENYAKREVVLEIAREKNISALLPGVTDVSYITGSWVAQELGLPGFDSPEISEIIFMKDLFHSWAEKHKYPVPKAVNNVEDARALSLPLLIKPTDAYSGLGITKITDWEEFETAIEKAYKASISRKVVIEEFCEGQLYSHSAFIRNGRILYEFFVDEYCTVYPWQVNSSCLSVTLSNEMRVNIHACMQTLISELRLGDGLLHTQFIANENNFWLIELTRRCPGDLYSRLIELSTSRPYSLWFTHPFLGIKSEFNIQNPQTLRAIVRHTVSVTQPQLFTSFEYASMDGKIIETLSLKLPGEKVNPAPHDRAGIVFAELNDYSKLKAMTPIFKKYISLS